jgi:hypothetical protein
MTVFSSAGQDLTEKRRSPEAMKLIALGDLLLDY